MYIWNSDKMFSRIHCADGDGDGAGGGSDWKTGLPEGVREWDEVKNADTPEKFWDQMTNMRSMIGASIRIPGEDAGTEDWKTFHTKLVAKVPGLIPKPDPTNKESMEGLYSALGKPAKVEDYKIPEIDLKGVAVDLKQFDSLRDSALKSNLTQAQFEGVVTELITKEIDATTARVNLKTEDSKGLMAEWGLAFDDKIKKINNFVNQTGAPEALRNAVDNGTLDTASAKWLNDLVGKFGGEGTNLISDKSKTGIMTPEEAKTKIGEIMGNKEHAYWNRQAPGNQDAIKYMLQLHKYSNPTASTDLSDLRAGPVSSELASLYGS